MSNVGPACRSPEKSLQGHSLVWRQEPFKNTGKKALATATLRFGDRIAVQDGPSIVLTRINDEHPAIARQKIMPKWMELIVMHDACPLVSRQTGSVSRQRASCPRT